MSIKTSSLICDFDKRVVGLIQNWLSVSDRTKSRLCKMSSFRPNSLNDLLEGRSSLINYQPARIVRLLAVLEAKEINQILKIYRSQLDHIEKYGKFAFANTIDLELSSNEDFTNAFVEAMRNPVAVAIYTMTTSDQGVSDAVLSERFGSYSKEIIIELLQKRIIMSAGSKYYATNREMLNLTRSQVQKIIPALNEGYKVNHSNKGRNYIYFRVDSINREALIKIHEAYSQLENTITELLEDPAHKGQIPFYGFAQMDTFKDELD